MLIIAEIGQNHNGDMRLAKKMIAAAKECGADVAKIQLYDVDSIFKRSFQWYKEAKNAQLSLEQVVDLSVECKKVGIEFSASVFDLERLAWLIRLNVKRIKIASRSIYNRTLVDAAAKTGKDLIISLGMYREKKFPVIKTTGKIDFLYCVSKYPTLLEELHFSKVDFTKFSGFSDHSIGVAASFMAMSRGASIIEKHFTLDKKMHGPDHKGSMDPCELKEIVTYSKLVKKML